ncbi:MAG: DNA polymerase IV [Candidatus Yanofskybacteria bacterium]|nr:DNA polymerase IV [Candidatus Yanofskybacteria bacterium]
MKRIIAHLDMDAFFAAIEERDTPRFKGMPLVIGADPKEGRGRGVVSTASYKAREYGIRSALPITRAWKLAEAARARSEPATIFLPVDMKKYSRVSDEIFEILKKYVPHVEGASIDEAYLDLSFTKSYAKAAELAQKIKSEIKRKEKLSASVGIGPNKLIAKIASDRQKPDGLTIITEKDVESFLEPLSIRTLPGIGPKTERFFQEKGIKTLRDLQKYSLEELQTFMGKWGKDLYERIRGRDESPIIEEWEVKSIGEQETFEEDTLNSGFIVERLQALCRGVIKRFQQEDFTAFRTVALTVRFENFTTKSRAHTLENPTALEEVLWREALKLLMPFFDVRENPKKYRIRLIGIRIEKLV